MTTLDGHAHEDISVSWWESLTVIQDLAFNTHEEVELPAELNDLISLTYLGLTIGDSEEEEKVCIDVKVNWPRMRSLRIYAYTQECMLLTASCCKL